MKPREQMAEPDDVEEAAPHPTVGYRVAGDIEIRSKVLEQELLETKQKLKAAEREVYAARKIVRRRKQLGAIATGGVGATIGVILGGIALVFVESSGVILGTTVIGFVLGALVGARWNDPDDDFPDAPAARTMY